MVDPVTDAADTLVALLDRRADDDRPGIVVDDRQWSWREVAVESLRWSAALAALRPDRGSVPRRGAPRQHPGVPVRALRRGPGRRGDRGHQRDPARRGAGPRRAPHRLCRGPHRREPEAAALRSRPRRHRGHRRRRSLVARSARRGAPVGVPSGRSGGHLRPHLHFRVHGRAQGGEAVARSRGPRRHRGYVVQLRRRPLLRDAALPRQRAQRDRLPGPLLGRCDRAAGALLRVAVHAGRPSVRGDVLQHRRTARWRTSWPPRSRPRTASTG